MAAQIRATERGTIKIAAAAQLDPDQPNQLQVHVMVTDSRSVIAEQNRLGMLRLQEDEEKRARTAEQRAARDAVQADMRGEFGDAKAVDLREIKQTRRASPPRRQAEPSADHQRPPVNSRAFNYAQPQQRQGRADGQPAAAADAKSADAPVPDLWFHLVSGLVAKMGGRLKKEEYNGQPETVHRFTVKVQIAYVVCVLTFAQLKCLSAELARTSHWRATLPASARRRRKLNAWLWLGCGALSSATARSSAQCCITCCTRCSASKRRSRAT